MYNIYFSKYALKDKKKLKNSGLENAAKQILNIMMENPFADPPSYEKLVGNYEELYSRRINRQHRIVYKVNETKKEIYIYRMWTQYDI